MPKQDKAVASQELPPGMREHEGCQRLTQNVIPDRGEAKKPMTAMLEIRDIRLFYENDVRFLRQF